MSMTREAAQDLLREHGLRRTAPRVAVLRALSEARQPLSLGELAKELEGAGGDQATLFRTMVRFRELGIARVVSQADRVDHYVLSVGAARIEHEHPHFECEACGEVTCLPSGSSVAISVEGMWAQSVHQAAIHLRGKCPTCC